MLIALEQATIHVLSTLFGGSLAAWTANPQCAAPATTYVTSSSKVADVTAKLEKMGWFVNMVGKTYKKPKADEAEPSTHSWFVAGNNQGNWFVVKFTNDAVHAKQPLTDPESA